MAPLKSSPIWNYFTVNEKWKGQCKICNQIISYKSTTFNLRKHIGRKHPGVKVKTKFSSVRKGKTCTRSAVWNYFTISEDDSYKAACQYCNKVISFKTNGTSSLRRHIARKHPTVDLNPLHQGVQEGEVNAEEAAAAVIASMGEAFPPGSVVFQLVADEAGQQSLIAQPIDHGNVTTSLSTSELPSKQKHAASPIRKFKPAITKATADVNNALLTMIHQDLRPFSTVEDRGFVTYSKALNPNYQLPSAKTLSESMLPAAYDGLRRGIQTEVLRAQFVCLTLDCWTSEAMLSYMAITAHFITPEMFLRTVMLDCLPLSDLHTTQNLCNEITSVINRWKLEGKIVQIVCDSNNGVANVVDALNLGGWTYSSCYANVMNLIVKTALLFFQPVLEKVRTIASYFARSPAASNALKSCLKQNNLLPKKVIQDVESHWTSTYHMLERFRELSDAINGAADSLNVQIPFLGAEELEECGELCEILQPFEEVTREMCAENYVGSSKVIVLTYGLINVCEKLMLRDYSHVVQEVLISLKAGLEAKFRDISEVNFLNYATFLDPRFKLIAFQPNDRERIKENVTRLVAEVDETPASQEAQSPASSALSPWNLFDHIKEMEREESTPEARANLEVASYLKEPLIPREDNQLHWWKTRKELYPNLFQQAKKYLCGMATSMPCGHIFSKEGIDLVERRRRLSGKNLQQLLFLHHNS